MKLKPYVTLVIAVFFTGSGLLLSGTPLKDTTAYDYLKSIQFFPLGAPLDFPAIELGGTAKLKFQFDDLAWEWNNYSYAIYHCTKDWKKSDLLPTQYLNGFPSNYFDNPMVSVGTFVPYTHYEVVLPNANCTPKISGNYVLEVFENDDPEAVIIRRRFLVYEDLAIASASVQRTVDLREFATTQQLNARVALNGYPVQDFFNDLDLSILQNRRWDNALTGLKPAFVQDGLLEYNFFGEQAFRGGVEFHSFDTKRLNQPGMGVQTSTLDTCWHIYLEPQKNRSISAYRAMEDINGRFLVQRADVANAAISGDYHWVEFYLESKELPVPVYVFGQLSQWELLPEFQLEYNETRGAYMGNILLKQGYYNYVFAHPALEDEVTTGTTTDGVSTELTEGTHWQTRNDYTLILYNRGMGLRYDRIIAYLKPSSAL